MFASSFNNFPSPNENFVSQNENFRVTSPLSLHTAKKLRSTLAPELFIGEQRSPLQIGRGDD